MSADKNAKRKEEGIAHENKSNWEEKNAKRKEEGIAHENKSNWEEKFRNWREERKERKEIELDFFGERKPSKKIIRKVEESDSQSARWKILLLLIPLAIFLYVVYANFLASHDFVYRYDIGKDEVLTPINRVSLIVSGTPDYQELTGQLVYFNAPIARGANEVDVKFRFKDNVPKGSTISLGAKDEDVWHYKYKSVYNPSLNRLGEFDKVGNVYLVNKNLYPVSFDELKYERNVIVASDELYSPLTNVVTGFQGESVISSSLRGAHTAYVYLEGDLKLEVAKQDINWYEGEDNLDINVYDSLGNLVGNMSILDDGEIGVSKEKTQIQSGKLEISNLKEGVYRIELGDFDGLIREIKVNTGKIVFDRVFLADNSLYGVSTKESKVFTKLERNEQLLLLTYHSEGLQKINYTKDGNSRTFNFATEDSTIDLELTAGEYEFNISKNDLVLYGSPYFAFSKEQYFEPFKQKVIPIRNDFDWLSRNVDYIVSDYSAPVKDGDWLVSEVSFDLEKDELYVNENGLSFIFNTPHLSQEGFENYTIPIDWIEIKVHKPGVFS